MPEPHFLRVTMPLAYEIALNVGIVVLLAILLPFAARVYRFIQWRRSLERLDNMEWRRLINAMRASEL